MKQLEFERLPIITKPADIYISLNDTVTDNLQALSDSEWMEVVNENAAVEVEESGHKGKKEERALTYVWIQKVIDSSVNHEYLNKKITPFDMKILEACISAQQQGSINTTINAIFKTFGSEREPFKVMKEKIMSSIKKLRHLDIKIDATDAYKKLNRLKNKQQPNSEGRYIFQGYILPAETFTANIRGKTVNGVVHFLGTSPILRYAIDKGHTYNIARNLLAASINNTGAFLLLKTYLITRIKAIKRARMRNKNFSTNIRLDTLYEKCEYTEAIKKNHRFKKTLHDNIVKYFEYLISQKELTDFKLLKEVKDKKTGKILDVECKNLKDANKIKIVY